MGRECIQNDLCLPCTALTSLAGVMSRQGTLLHSTPARDDQQETYLETLSIFIVIAGIHSRIEAVSLLTHEAPRSF